MKLAFVGAVVAQQTFYQCRFAGAVLAEQAVNAWPGVTFSETSDRA